MAQQLIERESLNMDEEKDIIGEGATAGYCYLITLSNLYNNYIKILIF